MAQDILASFVDGLKDAKTGAPVTTVAELKQNQFGIPLKHYAQQYLFGATALRLQVFNSIQGEKEVGKSTMMFDIMGDICGSEDDGGLGGIAVIYEMEGKISPTILYSILRNHGERATQACLLKLGMTLEEAMTDLNKVIIPQYIKACPNLDKPLMIGFDSIGGSAVDDTIDKLQKEGVAGKGFYNKQHFMKYFCENQGVIFSRYKIPVVVICINQERESVVPGQSVPSKTITGGRAQLFKDGHMIRASKKALASGDGNVLTLRTAKTSFCDSREIEVEFRWNKFGKVADDAYEAHFLWELASARCLADPTKGVGDLRSICDVKVSDQRLVTCPQLDLKSVSSEEFEAALMSNEDMLNQLYTFQKIEKLRDLSEYSVYIKEQKTKAKGKDKDKDETVEQEEKPAPKKSRKKKALSLKAVIDELNASADDSEEDDEDNG